MQKRIFHIESNDAVARDTFRIVLRTDGPVAVRSGQFVDLDIPGYYLRRPISVSDSLPDGVVLYYKVVGEGTRVLSTMSPGSSTELLCSSVYDRGAFPPDPLRRDAPIGPVSRRARFRTVVALILADGQPHFFEGVCEGSIAREKHGAGGFGYDPIFLPDAFPGLTFAEISEEDKNSVSHRGRAIRAMAAWLKAR